MKTFHSLLTAGAGAVLLASAAALPASGTAAAPAAKRPNVVFVLTDDLSWNLLKYMPQVQRIQRQGTTFADYTVTDSLCCPSRSSILSGRFPHNTGVFTNSAPDGGFGVFHGRGEESRTFATGLHAAGYRTAMMGKYLNGYQPVTRRAGPARTCRPAGTSGTWPATATPSSTTTSTRTTRSSTTDTSGRTT